MQKFVTDDNFWELFPDAVIGVLSLKNVQESVELNEEQAAEVEAMLKAANKEALKYVPSDVISENPVVDVWRQAYKKFKTKKGARCSLENLLKRVSKGNPVGTIAPSVDITNSISLKYAFPIGVEDRGAFAGDIRLGLMKGGESFLPIGSEKEEPPYENELAYYDEQGVICRCWNWRDGQRTAVSEKTTDEFIAMECVEPERAGELAKALDELAELLMKYLGAEVVAKDIVTKDKREMVIG